MIKHGIVGIGPYMRAYERQEYFKGFVDPPPGVMPRWRTMLARCTGTTFDRGTAPTSPLRITFVNRPWAQGRSLVNLGEVVDWMRAEWLPGLRLGVPVDVRVEGEVRHTTTLAEQVRVFTDTSVLVYPHGATMTHAMFLPRGAAVLEIIPWPNVTEPHGWLEVCMRALCGVAGGTAGQGKPTPPPRRCMQLHATPTSPALRATPGNSHLPGAACNSHPPDAAQAIARQMELTELDVGLMVNNKRSNVILNWEVREGGGGGGGA